MHRCPEETPLRLERLPSSRLGCWSGITQGSGAEIVGVQGRFERLSFVELIIEIQEKIMSEEIRLTKKGDRPLGIFSAQRYTELAIALQ